MKTVEKRRLEKVPSRPARLKKVSAASARKESAPSSREEPQLVEVNRTFTARWEW